jgi:uncharacterized protein (TIGR03089 family)
MASSPIVAALAPLSRDPGRPRLTWYGPDDERIELSGAVLVNWMAKCTNMLVEELDVEPGTRVLLDLPAHWRATVWALGAWCAGAEVSVGTGPDDTIAAAAPEVVLTHRPSAWVGRAPLVAAVALPGLARRWDGAEPLPAGVVDAAAAVMSFGDQIGYLPPVDDHAQALLAPGSGTDGDSTGGKPVTYGGLLAWAAATGHVPGARTLVTTADPGSAAQAAPAPLATALRECLGAWAADASVVLCGREHSARLREDPALRARLVTQEQVG